MVPPLPAVSRPSKITTTLRPRCTIHSCIRTSSVCSRASSFSYADLLTILGLGASVPPGTAGIEGCSALLAFVGRSPTAAERSDLPWSGDCRRVNSGCRIRRRPWNILVTPLNTALWPYLRPCLFLVQSTAVIPVVAEPLEAVAPGGTGGSLLGSHTEWGEWVHNVRMATRRGSLVAVSLVAALAVSATLLVTSPAGATAASYSSTDPCSATVDSGVCVAGITADYTSTTVTLGITVGRATDPTTDPNWDPGHVTSGATGIVWN